MNTTVAELALAARDYVERATGLDLDGSVESLAYVDHYLARVGEVSDAALPLLAAAIGAYLGEIVLARHAGAWRSDGDPWTWVLALDEPAVTFQPAGMAAEAVRRGPVEGFDAEVAVPPDLAAPLDDALAAAPPVDEDYYYSLTGRLETLEHILELLAALRQARAASPSEK